MTIYHVVDVIKTILSKLWHGFIVSFIFGSISTALVFICLSIVYFSILGCANNSNYYRGTELIRELHDTGCDIERSEVKESDRKQSYITVCK